MDLILVRHGETDWNRASIFRGRMDIPLNSTGLAQARLTARALQHQNISTIYSSPLARSLKTAEIIAQPHSINVTIDDDLIDIDYGALQGISEKEAVMQYPLLMETWSNHPEKVKFPCGESLHDVLKRIQNFFDRICVFSRTENRAVLVVSHRIPIKIMTLILLGMDLSHLNEVRHDNCAISIFKIRENSIEQSILNYTKHLDMLSIDRLKDF
ncbi:MAG: histidine phosphatase family protein [Methanomassiliicoccales archaeon]